MVTLREARIRNMLTIRALALAAGVSPATIQLAESGQRIPHFGTMRKIAAVLGVAVDEVDEFRHALEAAIEGKEAA
jgi:transcriptional regulator with XRE-family HTH domain